MTDIAILAVVLILGLMTIVLFYVLSSYAYEMTDTSIRLHWRVSSRFTFASREIGLKDIVEVRGAKSVDSCLGMGYVLGKVPFKRGVTIIFKRRALPHGRVVVTPDDPEQFIHELTKRLRNFQQCDGASAITT